MRHPYVLGCPGRCFIAKQQLVSLFDLSWMKSGWKMGYCVLQHHHG